MKTKPMQKKKIKPIKGWAVIRGEGKYRGFGLSILRDMRGYTFSIFESKKQANSFTDGGEDEVIKVLIIPL